MYLNYSYFYKLTINKKTPKKTPYASKAYENQEASRLLQQQPWRRSSDIPWKLLLKSLPLLQIPLHGVTVIDRDVNKSKHIEHSNFQTCLIILTNLIYLLLQLNLNKLLSSRIKLFTRKFHLCTNRVELKWNLNWN